MDSNSIDESASRPRNKRNRGLLSCVECHRRKQKCNRLLPCNDCTQRGVPYKCEYKIPTTPNQALNLDQMVQGNSRKVFKYARFKRIISGNEVILTPESVEALQGLGASVPTDILSSRELPQYFIKWNPEFSKRLGPIQIRDPWPLLVSEIPPSVDPWFLGSPSGLDPFSSLPPSEGEPIPRQILIFYFLQKLAPWLSSYDKTKAPTSPRVSWFPFAINSPALFYATLLSSAVHLDRKQPLGDQRKLLWYKVRTMRLANENLQASKGATDEMILVALILLYFNVGGDNQMEYEIHLRGIHQMLKVRGGVEHLGMRGMVKNWLSICYGPWVEGWEYGRVY